VSDTPVPEDANEEERRDAARLSEADTEKLTAWLREKSKNARCPVCENAPTNWIVGDHLIHGMPYYPGGSLVLGGSAAYPQAFVVCDNCFYVRAFMAVPIGLEAATKAAENG